MNLKQFINLFKRSFDIKVIIKLSPDTSTYVNSLYRPEGNIGVRIDGAKSEEENKNGFHPNRDERIFHVFKVKPDQKLTIKVGEENVNLKTKEFTVEENKLEYIETI